MRELLPDLSIPALVTAIKANLFEHYRYLGRSQAAEFSEGAHLTWMLSGIPHPFLNVVLRARFPSGQVDDLIDEALAQFRSRELPGISWWVEADSLPEDLGERLLAHGLVFTEGSPGMAASLYALNEEVSTPPGFEIQRVTSPEAMRQWATALTSGFELPGTERAAFRLYAGLGYELPLYSYVGFLDGAPAATAQLFLGAGVAGLYCVSTVAEARRQGIGAAIVLETLRTARELGYSAAILHSSPQGYNVYRRLGFQELCRTPHFVWSSAG